MEDQFIQWVVTTLSVGQGLSLAKLKERLWYQDFCRSQEARMKTQLQ